MFCKKSEEGYTEVAPGVRIKTVVYGDKTSMTEFLLARGSRVPAHQHPHEQTGYLIRGGLRLTIGGEVNDVQPGDAWNVAGGIEHEAEVVEDSVIVEVFSPVREDYLPRD